MKTQKEIRDEIALRHKSIESLTKAFREGQLPKLTFDYVTISNESTINALKWVLGEKE